MNYKPSDLVYDKLIFGDIIDYSDADLRFIHNNSNEEKIFEIVKIKAENPWFGNEKLLIYTKSKSYEIFTEQDIIDGEELTTNIMKYQIRDLRTRIVSPELQFGDIIEFDGCKCKVIHAQKDCIILEDIIKRNLLISRDKYKFTVIGERDIIEGEKY